MKPFNLEAALKGAKVVTRDGRPVKIAGYNEDSENLYWRLVGWIDGNPSWWSLLGKAGAVDQSSYDLFMAPTERKEWVVRVERHNGNKFISGPFANEKEYSAFIESLSNGCTYTIHEITIHE